MECSSHLNEAGSGFSRALWRDASVLIDKTHLGWGIGSAAALGVATAGYALSVAGPGEGSGGSIAGLMFGIASLAAMTFAGLLAVRKKFPGLRLGSAQFWLRGHIWLGLLSVPLAFYHSSFRFGGTLETALMIVFLAVIASGVYGLAMQQMLPRFLKVRVPLETFPQQIPHLCQKFLEEGDQLIKDLQKPIKKAGPSSSVGAAATAGATSAAAAKAPNSATAALLAKAAAKKAGAAAAPMKSEGEAPAAPADPTAAPAATTEVPPAAAPAAPKSSAAAAILAAKAAKIAAAKAAAGGADVTAKPMSETATAAPVAPPQAAVAKPAVAGPRSIIKATAAPADAVMPRLELLTRFYRERVTPFLSSDPDVASRQELASENYARMAFANLAVDLPAQALAAVERLEEIVAERRQFLVQVRIQNWLRNWLLIHVPLSAALFVLAALHVVMALRVVPWF
jgi:hypothetical protein